MVCADKQLQTNNRPSENDGLRILISFTRLNPYFKPCLQALSNCPRNRFVAQIPFRSRTGRRWQKIQLKHLNFVFTSRTSLLACVVPFPDDIVLQDRIHDRTIERQI